VEKHLIEIGLLKGPNLSDDQREFLAKKRADFEARGSQKDAFSSNSFPEGAQLCGKCSTAATVMLDGCMTCLNCGYSKCG
jgi:hypothetical protein